MRAPKLPTCTVIVRGFAKGLLLESIRPISHAYDGNGHAAAVAPLPYERVLLQPGLNEHVPRDIVEKYSRLRANLTITKRADDSYVIGPVRRNRVVRDIVRRRA